MIVTSTRIEVLGNFSVVVLLALTSSQYSSSGVTCEIPHHENRDFASDLMLPRILAGTAIVRVLMLLPSACYSGIQR